MQLPPARAPPTATYGSPIAAPQSLNHYFKEETEGYVELDGARVRHMRGGRGFNGATFARRAGVSPETLRRVERNRGPVRVTTARKIGAAVGVGDPRSLGRIAGRA
jgi:DNA-binding XRE family transcriptional regulator